MSIGERVKQLRSELKLTQLDFGRRIGVSGATVSTTESGKTTPDNQTILLICREFGINRLWLETGEGPKYPEEVQNGPEALIPDLVGILNSYPAVLNVMQRVVRHMKPSDWERLNQLLDEASAKKDTEA